MSARVMILIVILILLWQLNAACFEGCTRNTPLVNLLTLDLFTGSSFDLLKEESNPYEVGTR